MLTLIQLPRKMMFLLKLTFIRIKWRGWWFWVETKLARLCREQLLARDFSHKKERSIWPKCHKITTSAFIIRYVTQNDQIVTLSSGPNKYFRSFCMNVQYLFLLGANSTKAKAHISQASCWIKNWFKFGRIIYVHNTGHSRRLTRIHGGWWGLVGM